MAEQSIFQTFKLNTKPVSVPSRSKTWNSFPATTGKQIFGAKPQQVSKSMRGVPTRTACVARCMTPAWFARSCRYDHDRIPTRRASSSWLHEARERVPFPCSHPLWLLHKPSVQKLCANGIGIGVPCLHPQAPRPETRELSRVPVGRTCVPPFRPKGVPGHRARESPYTQETRTGVRQDKIGRVGFCAGPP